MFGGIALAWGELPLALVEKYRLEERAHERGGEREVRFLFRAVPRWLPVWYEGELRLVAWGCRRGESTWLPSTGWTWKSSVEAGRWRECRAEPVDIPATMGLENGVWYHIRQGLRGL